MKQEIDFLTIHGGYGGNQSWFWDPAIRIGGCAALTACELSAYLAQRYPAYQKLYPFDPYGITKMDFIRFGRHMKHFIAPRPRGVYRLSFYEDGFIEYAEHNGTTVQLDKIQGERPYEEAEAFLKAKIDAGIPVPFLLLKHINHEFSDYTWHWFIMTGYEVLQVSDASGSTDSKLYAIFGTYGKRHRVDFQQLWNTGFEEKGGMITIRTPDSTLEKKTSRDG